ncbi:MAG TPA: hypothetical protein VHD83_13315 [Puia sp.]|nr:hypothetical protein [Puia sp.]
MGEFMWSDHINRMYLLGAVLITTALWTVFKYFYPYPNVIFDSYNYVRAAALHWNYNAWPIGYSKFLQVFAGLTHSALMLTTFQYFFLEFSCLLFFFTWRAVFQPDRIVSNIFFALLFVNPLFIFCCNFIISDGLFIGISLLWITQLFLIIRRPRPYMVITQALLLFAAFTIRYNALYYPLVVTLAFLFSRERAWFKIGGIALPLLLVGCFIQCTRHEVKKGTDQAQFSAFGSWKLANDVLYMYAHVPPEKIEDMAPRFHQLENEVQQYFHQFSKPVGLAADDDFTSGSRYMYFLNSPLVTYMHRKYPGEFPIFLNTRSYWQVAPLYQDYALYLVRKNPVAFGRWFLWPNLGRYIMPPEEIFNSEESFVLKYSGPYFHELFHLDTLYTPPHLVNLGVQLMEKSAGIVRMGHLCFLPGLVVFLLCSGFRQMSRPSRLCLVLATGLWACDFCFSLVSAAIVLRYQLFVMVLELGLGLYFIEYIYHFLDRRVPVISADSYGS